MTTQWMAVNVNNYEILLATMLGQQGKFFISDRLKRLEKLNICRRQKISIISKCFLRNYLKIYGLKFRFEVANVFNYKS